MRDPILLTLAILLAVGLYVWTAASLHAVLRKAGEPAGRRGCPCSTPSCCCASVASPRWWILSALVPVVGIALFVILVIAYHRIVGRVRFRRGHDGARRAAVARVDQRARLGLGPLARRPGARRSRARPRAARSAAGRAPRRRRAERLRQPSRRRPLPAPAPLPCQPRRWSSSDVSVPPGSAPRVRP